MRWKLTLSICLLAIMVVVGFRVFRHSSGGPSKPYAACLMNLSAIESAKQVWAEENHKSTNDAPPTFSELTFLARIPECPCGGRYTLGSVGQPAKCSLTEAEHTWGRWHVSPTSLPGSTGARSL
jgi:hypothetical protein